MHPALLLLALAAASAPEGARERAIAFSGGWFGFRRDRNEAVELRVEYRSGGRWRLRPLAGLTATTDGSVHLCAGIGLDVRLWSRRLVVTPSFASGLYAKGGGEDLGYPLEFRSQLELAYRFRNGSRLGVSISHLSNGGLGERNGGVESVVVSYEVPLARLFGRPPRVR